MTSPTAATFRLATPRTAGAIAVFELVGDIDSTIDRLVEPTRAAHLNSKSGRLVLASLLDDDGSLIDAAVVGRVTDRFAMFMVHGGARVVQRVRDRLLQLGVRQVQEADDPRELWPEASTADEALMLEALSRTHSRAGLDLLATQPDRWRRFRSSGESEDPQTIERIRVQARILNRLITPPTVVVVGRPNVGKSTLTNALVGRSASIESDQAGTTRDYVAALVDLSGLAVWWYDTPGRRETSDPIEAESIRISNQVVASADLLVHASSPDLPDELQNDDGLPRDADLRILLKSDQLTKRSDDGRSHHDLDIMVSSHSGEGIEQLVRTVRNRLLPPEIMMNEDPWFFDARLLATDFGG